MKMHFSQFYRGVMHQRPLLTEITVKYFLRVDFWTNTFFASENTYAHKKLHVGVIFHILQDDPNFRKFRQFFFLSESVKPFIKVDSLVGSRLNRSRIFRSRLFQGQIRKISTFFINIHFESFLMNISKTAILERKPSSSTSFNLTIEHSRKFSPLIPGLVSAEFRTGSPQCYIQGYFLSQKVLEANYHFEYALSTDNLSTDCMYSFFKFQKSYPVWKLIAS